MRALAPAAQWVEAAGPGAAGGKALVECADDVSRQLVVHLVLLAAGRFPVGGGGGGGGVRIQLQGLHALVQRPLGVADDDQTEEHDGEGMVPDGRVVRLFSEELVQAAEGAFGECLQSGQSHGFNEPVGRFGGDRALRNPPVEGGVVELAV